jgi:hypothetical protein
MRSKAGCGADVKIYCQYSAKQKIKENERRKETLTDLEVYWTA